MIDLREMTEAEFNVFRESTIKSFAAGNVTAGNWEQPGAESRATETLEQLLPAGAATTGHRFYAITGEQGDLGTLWIFVKGDTAFLFDIMIDKKFRGKGFGHQTMDFMEKKLVGEGISEIELHVFGHNTPARALYLKTGYLETDVTMKKNCCQGNSTGTYSFRNTTDIIDY
ncbi:MAG: GNAT family N-acetyltransferase [Candidatus Sabulitectum sp.]|nr:GNAT family N-acetyltransferase [Candidatus Sabulitectum sp.]